MNSEICGHSITGSRRDAKPRANCRMARAGFRKGSSLPSSALRQRSSAGAPRRKSLATARQAKSKLNGVSFSLSLSSLSLFLYIVEIHILSLCLWQEGLVPETGCAATGSLPNAVYEEVEIRLFRV